MSDKKDLKNRLGGFLKTKKGQKIAVIILIAAAALIALSDLISFSEEKPQKEEKTLTAEEYSQTVSEKLEEMLSSMAGVGECNVMVTLKGSEEALYVTETKENTDSEQKSDGSGKSSHQNETGYIIIEDGNGKQTALFSKVICPEINGVLIVCDGGASPTVREKVVSAVKTALGIGSDRIYVTDKG